MLTIPMSWGQVLSDHSWPLIFLLCHLEVTARLFLRLSIEFIIMTLGGPNEELLGPQCYGKSLKLDECNSIGRGEPELTGLNHVMCHQLSRQLV